MRLLKAVFTVFFYLAIINIALGQTGCATADWKETPKDNYPEGAGYEHKECKERKLIYNKLPGPGGIFAEVTICKYIVNLNEPIYGGCNLDASRVRIINEYTQEVSFDVELFARQSYVCAKGLKQFQDVAFIKKESVKCLPPNGAIDIGGKFHKLEEWPKIENFDVCPKKDIPKPSIGRIYFKDDKGNDAGYMDPIGSAGSLPSTEMHFPADTKDDSRIAQKRREIDRYLKQQEEIAKEFGSNYPGKDKMQQLIWNIKSESEKRFSELAEALKSGKKIKQCHCDCGGGIGICDKCQGKIGWTCGKCNGTGRVNCEHGEFQCDNPATGKTKCTTCYGKGTEYCTHCEMGLWLCYCCRYTGYEVVK